MTTSFIVYIGMGGIRFMSGHYYWNAIPTTAKDEIFFDGVPMKTTLEEPPLCHAKVMFRGSQSQYSNMIGDAYMY